MFCAIEVAFNRGLARWKFIIDTAEYLIPCARTCLCGAADGDGGCGACGAKGRQRNYLMMYVANKFSVTQVNCNREGSSTGCMHGKDRNLVLTGLNTTSLDGLQPRARAQFQSRDLIPCLRSLKIFLM